MHTAVLKNSFRKFKVGNIVDWVLWSNLYSARTDYHNRHSTAPLIIIRILLLNSKFLQSLQQGRCIFNIDPPADINSAFGYIFMVNLQYPENDLLIYQLSVEESNYNWLYRLCYQYKFSDNSSEDKEESGHRGYFETKLLNTVPIALPVTFKDLILTADPDGIKRNGYSDELPSEKHNK